MSILGQFLSARHEYVLLRPIFTWNLFLDWLISETNDMWICKKYEYPNTILSQHNEPTQKSQASMGCIPF